ncbi:hypothetical protein V2J09_015335 [Rumex salicifolius]
MTHDNIGLLSPWIEQTWKICSYSTGIVTAWLVMDFWKCLNEGKGLFLPEELELPSEVGMNARNKVSEQEPNALYDTPSCHFVSNQESIRGQDSVQFGFSDSLGTIRQANCSDPSRNVLSNHIGLDCYTEVASPNHTTPDSASQEKQLGSRMPSLFVGSDCLDLPTVDLKLGGESSKSAASRNSSTPSVPTKRTRLTSSYSQTPACQVHGCNKDLSSYKDYYKRHKVCDAHTKTATVIVKGIEQRFCQQCSRFHLLAEFDDGKRSCRKRLANHNERRRKSPVSLFTHSGKLTLLNRDLNAGTRFLRSSSMRSSFLFQEMSPHAVSDPSKPEPGKWFSHMKYEDSTLDSNLLLSFHDNTSVGTLDKNAGIAVPNYQDLSQIPDSSRALSLLSAHSLKASEQLLGIAMSSSSAATLTHNNYTAQGPTDATSAVSSGDIRADAKVPDDSMLFGSNSNSNSLNNKYSLSSGQGTVVDLLQLSSHLQMVEHKRNLMH